MKKVLLISLAICLVFLTACSEKTSYEDNSAMSSEQTISSSNRESMSSQDDTLIAGNDPTTETRSEESKESESTRVETIPSQTEDTSAKNNEKPKQSESESTQKTDTSSKVTVSSSSDTETNNDVETEINTESEQDKTVVDVATAEDTKEIAEKMVEYINTYRAEQGVSSAAVLPGLTRYAEYRSMQLVSNFAHDTNDERAAASALEYGIYIDPELYGISGEPYYTANAREAIIKSEHTGTVDFIAERLALLTRNSSGHWAYVGAEKYTYIAVGITYADGKWYCDIAVTRENTDN